MLTKKYDIKKLNIEYIVCVFLDANRGSSYEVAVATRSTMVPNEYYFLIEKKI